MYNILVYKYIRICMYIKNRPAVIGDVSLDYFYPGQCKEEEIQ